MESFQLYFNAFRNYKTADEDGRQLSYMELMGISWCLHMVHAFYSVFALFLGVKSYAYFSESKDFTHLILETFSFKFQKISVLTTLSHYWKYLKQYRSNLFFIPRLKEKIRIYIFAS